MQEIPQAVIDGAAGMSQATLLWIMGGLMTVITILGNLAKSLIDRKTNPLNGTLGKLDASLTTLNTTLAKVEVRTSDSDRVLANHTEKLVVLGTTMAQLAANEAAQTEAVRTLGPSIDNAITGLGARMTKHCDAHRGAIIDALDTRG